MAIVQLSNVSKTFPGARHEEVVALSEVSLEVAHGELVALVGPSGAGKSTALRMIAGLESISSGKIFIDGIEMNDVAPKDRDVALVLQNPALFPHLTAFENMAFGLRLRKVPRAEIEQRVQPMAEVLGLTQYLDRLPRALSGGQRQRVALGRALVRQPKVFLFDEPLSNLDGKMRVQLRTEIARLHADLNATMIYVTHDETEAMTLASRIVVLKEGIVQQVGEPLTLYNAPANVFVAGFIGSPAMNFFRGQVQPVDNGFAFCERTISMSAGAPFQLPLSPERGHRLLAFAEGKVILGLRAQHLGVVDDARHALLQGTVELVEPRGAETFIHVKTAAHSLVARARADRQPARGDAVLLSADMDQAFFFHPVSETVIA